MTATMPTDYERLLTPADVARAFAVSPKTVTRWARAGILHPIRTPGGHRRYTKREVDELREAMQEKPDVV